MKTLSYIKSHKLITSVISVALIATTGGVSYALVNNNAETKQEVAQATTSPEPKKEVAEEVKEVDEVKEQVVTGTPAPSQTPTPTATPTPTESPKPTNPYPAGSALAYVYDKRKASNKQMGVWGSGTSIAANARANGVPVDSIPQFGDIAVSGTMVWFVDSVVQGESFTISTLIDGKIHSSTYKTAEAAQRRFLFIH